MQYAPLSLEEGRHVPSTCGGGNGVGGMDESLHTGEGADQLGQSLRTGNPAF